jgi:hypothetical protein
MLQSVVLDNITVREQCFYIYLFSLGLGGAYLLWVTYGYRIIQYLWDALTSSQDWVAHLIVLGTLFGTMYLSLLLLIVRNYYLTH